jgi:predicted ATPase/transcriptional regulator with XRE-family HTH domain
VAGAPAFGALLKRYRLAAGLSQETLADRAGMSANGIGALERGDRRTPRRETLALLADALDLSAEQRRAFSAAALRPALIRAAGSAAAHGPWPDAPSSNLPLSLTSFVGRTVELADVAALLRAHRLVTLTGSGGIGKSRTALEAGAAYALEHEAGVWLAELAPLSDPSFVMATIAGALGVQEVRGRPLAETVLAYLRGKKILLVIDNCEHVIAATARIVDTLLRGCSALRILATSRESLRVPGEHAYRLPSLDAPSEEAARRLRAGEGAMYAAIELFADRACSVDRRFVLTDQSVPHVAEICRRLDGIPLAIELAAARVPMLHVTALLEKLDQRFSLLTSGDRTAFPRQQTMRATIDWSYDLLSAQEQRLFRRLAVFPEGCTLEAAAAVCTEAGATDIDVLPDLSSLVDKSLLIADVEGAHPRYRLLETFRTYAHERLVGHDEAQMTTHRHAEAYVTLAERLEREWAARSDGDVFATVGAEFENWRAALAWSLSPAGDRSLGLRLAAALGFAWTEFAPSVGRRWTEAALALASDTTPPRVLAKLELNASMLAFAAGEEHTGLVHAERALQRYRELGDDVAAARVQCVVGGALVSAGRGEEAEPLLDEALLVARARGEHVLCGRILSAAARSRAAVGDFPGARARFAQAREQFGRAPGALYHFAWLTGLEAETEYRAGDLGTALQLAADALAKHRIRDDERLLSESLCRVACYLNALDLFSDARTHAREALLLARETHDDVCTAAAVQHMAAAFALDGHADARRATLLLGFVRGSLAALPPQRTFSERAEYERAVIHLRTSAGADAVRALLDRGAALSQDEAVAEALRT